MSCHLISTFMKQVSEILLSKLKNVSGMSFIEVYMKMTARARLLLPFSILLRTYLLLDTLSTCFLHVMALVIYILIMVHYGYIISKTR